MATGRRRTRSLSLGGRRFLWRCEFNDPAELSSADYHERGSTWRPDTLVVRPEDGPHRRLTVAWPPCKGPIATPGLVRAYVEEALQQGWLTAMPVLELTGAG